MVCRGEFQEDGEEFEEFGYDKIMALSAEGFDFFDVVLEDGWLSTVMEAVEFGNVVDFDIVADCLGELTEASRTVAVVFAAFEIFEIVVFEFFFEGEVVELAAEGELAIDFFLGDVEVFDVEETDVLGGVGELVGELLLAVWLIKETEVESH